MANASKPGPRLALDPGTRKVLAGVNLSLWRYGREHFNRHVPRYACDGKAERPDLTDCMNPRRYHCSHLVTLRNNSTESAVNLEEIWTEGAVLESEEEIKEGARVEILCDAACFSGRIGLVERHEFGWRFEVEFSPLTPWNPERFRPQHLIDLSKLGSD
jgi:hypothetical protein